MDSQGAVLFVDDELHVRLAGQQTLELAGYECVPCESAEEALQRLTPDWSGVVVTDVRMPGMDGLQLMSRCRVIDPDLPVVVITGHGDINMAVQALKDGAYDFLEKPYRTERLLDAVRRAMEKRQLVLENRKLREELGAQSQLAILGRAPRIARLREVVANVAATDADVLIEGETGVGKELVARALHAMSPRRNGPFVPINCGALPESVIESELFGHEAGSFTGANRRRIGKFEHANGGTLFLDEIESIPLLTGVRLLRVLQERVVERVGSNVLNALDIRVVAATKADLRKLSDQGEFRADLYYRLNVLKITVPPLRQRKEDIPLLFQHFVNEAAKRHSRPLPMLEPALISGLIAKQWPGNVRELSNAAERFVLGYADDLLNSDCGEVEAGSHLALPEQVAAFEKSIIELELSRHGGNVTATYRALGIPRKTLYDKLTKYGLSRQRFLDQ